MAWPKLAAVVRYDPETGHFFWLPQTPDMFKDTKRLSAVRGCEMWNRRWAGRQLTSKNDEGYPVIHHRSHRGVLAHRLAFFIVHGYCPRIIDHIDGDRANNRIANLRAADETINARNRHKRSPRNVSGKSGVHWWEKYQVWQARIKVDGKYHYLGSFRDKDEAIAARIKAEGEFGFTGGA